MKQLWRWPLYSPRRLAVTVVAVLAVIVLIGSARGHGGHKVAVATASPPTTAGIGQPASGPASTGRTATTTAGSSPTTAAQATTVPPPSTAPPAAMAAAAAFVQAWASHQPQPQWSAVLAPLATPQLAAGLAQTDPNNVPATAVNGPPSGNGDAGGAQVKVPTDGGIVVVVVVANGPGWLVSSIAPLPKG